MSRCLFIATIAIKHVLTANINLHLEIASDLWSPRSSQLNGLSDEGIPIATHANLTLGIQIGIGLFAGDAAGQVKWIVVNWKAEGS